MEYIQILYKDRVEEKPEYNKNELSAIVFYSRWTGRPSFYAEFRSFRRIKARFHIGRIGCRRWPMYCAYNIGGTRCHTHIYRNIQYVRKNQSCPDEWHCSADQQVNVKIFIGYFILFACKSIAYVNIIHIYRSTYTEYILILETTSTELLTWLIKYMLKYV